MIFLQVQERSRNLKLGHYLPMVKNKNATVRANAVAERAGVIIRASKFHQ